MFSSKLAATVATFSFVLSPTLAVAELPISSCWQPEEASAASLFAFETMLMVGTLRCRARDASVEASYRAFADARSAMIARHADTVRMHFIADRGVTAGGNAFSDYETTIGNLTAAAPDNERACATLGAYARLASRASEPDLLALAQATEPAPPRICTAAVGDGSNAGPAVPAERVIAVAPTLGGARPVAAAMPAAIAAQAPAAPPTPAAALADAARALSAAAAALQAQAAAPPN